MNRAYSVLQQHDEWMEQCVECNYMDTGDALDQIASLKMLAESIIESQEEL